MRDFLSICSALSDESRLRLLLALRGRELCVCQMTELLGLATSTVSKHITILKQAGLVESRKTGRWIYCRLAGRNAAPLVQQAIRFACHGVDGDERSRQDARHLETILNMDPEELCKRQCQRK